ncbi:hypothetical protein MUU77_01385 [Pseudoxanthomonas sp. F37]|uniref:hypothetical protein n=1 Tax=Pseudoxanthomonas sp. F37 TaxID=2932492 RepID=UPI001FD3C822|nr:hypothetical protein [Pseudoxanthomonas sp. F37]UOV09001.1 hypothetical protein MUU77_01385 [Pseudoxanthomonas sp. F37]
MMDLSDFKYIWDGTDPGWVVHRRTEDREHLSIVFPDGADLLDLKAMRAVLPELAAASAVDVMALNGALSFDLGEHESSIARRLKELCASRQLTIRSEAQQFVRYGVVNELRRVYCIIEDNELNRAVAEHAIHQGVPVRESTV